MTTLQNAVVRNMVASLSVPTFHVGYTITTDALDKLYKQIKSKGVTMTALLAKAVAVTLQKHPLVNAAYVENGIQHPSSINVSVAVAMEDGGLITPVLQQADQMDIYSLSRTWQDLVARARSKQLQPQEYNSGTFTLSNLGMFGVDRFDAILPPGQGAILAIGASRPQVVATDDGMLGVRRQMQVNITCDHRIIYGADAAAFLKDLAALIETNPQSLTL
jgi:pyruvate dehydrogenase E2 component (dihydrolipoamide acetyltransferase)